ACEGHKTSREQEKNEFAGLISANPSGDDRVRGRAPIQRAASTLYCTENKIRFVKAWPRICPRCQAKGFSAHGRTRPPAPPPRRAHHQPAAKQAGLSPCSRLSCRPESRTEGRGFTNGRPTTRASRRGHRQDSCAHHTNSSDRSRGQSRPVQYSCGYVYQQGCARNEGPD